MTASDFCNGLTAADDPNDELFASFTASGAQVSCGSRSLTVEGDGIWQNKPDDAFFPLVYGSFTMTDDDGDTDTFDCTIYLDDGENINTNSSCTNSAGSAVPNVTSTCDI